MSGFETAPAPKKSETASPISGVSKPSFCDAMSGRRFGDWRHVRHMELDRDLSSLRDTERYQRLLRTMKLRAMRAGFGPSRRALPGLDDAEIRELELDSGTIRVIIDAFDPERDGVRLGPAPGGGR